MLAADLLRAAFRDVHGARLYGFALLLTLGQRARAGALAAAALDAGAARVDALRHPERAAAWLRARVVRDARGLPNRPQSVAERRTVLGELGMSEAAADALGELGADERAVLIAAVIEGLEIGDVATVMGREIGDVHRLLSSARRRYLASASHWLRERPPAAIPAGPIAARVEAAAAWAVAASPRGAQIP
ncbi:MAG TPA: sigma factor-like helix-turn-helix DNA-binding protein [Candidatus Limnocylindria bacterium]|nr:sigma factor-like helix-turn-helix DNA-binding protein [Candidatus Limnocylindria bacterium]